MRSKKAAKNIIASLIQQVIIIICGLIVPRAIIKNFGSNVNGLISSISQFLSYITLLESGIGPVIRSSLYKPIAKKDKKQIEKILKASEKFFRTISGIFIIYLIVLCFIYPKFISTEFETSYTVSIIIIIAISTFAEYFFGIIYRLYIQAEQKYYIVSLIQIFTTILNTIVVIILIKLNCNVQIVKLGSAFVFVLKPILQNLYVKNKYHIKLRDVKSDYKLEQKWDGLAQHIASVIHDNTDVALLTIFVGTVEVSVYTVYMFVMNGIKNIIQAVANSIQASFGDMIAKNEKENLNVSFRTYELFYHTIVTVIFSITLVMILPFIKVYTMGISDANYYRPTFAFLITLAEFTWALRTPYSGITLTAGHFKQTRRGAWIEAFTNIGLSIILLFKFGMIGVAIGTFVSMIIRTSEFMYYASKHILERNQKENIKRVIVIACEIILVTLVGFLVSSFIEVNSYFTWILLAILVGIISVCIIGTINCFMYKNDFKNLVNMIKRIFKKKKEV